MMETPNNNTPFSKDEIERGIKNGKTIADLIKDRGEKNIRFSKKDEISSDPIVAGMRKNIEKQVESLSLDFYELIKKLYPERDAKQEIQKVFKGEDIDGFPSGNNQISKLLKVANELEKIQQEKKTQDTREFLIFAERASKKMEESLSGIQEFIANNFNNEKMNIDLDNKLQETIDFFADIKDKTKIIELINTTLNSHPDKQMFSSSKEYMAEEIVTREELISKLNRVKEEVSQMQTQAIPKYAAVMNLLNSKLLN